MASNHVNEDTQTQAQPRTGYEDDNKDEQARPSIGSGNVNENIQSQEQVNKSSSWDLPLLALNRVSFRCKSLVESIDFYKKVMGFVSIERPSSFDFEGASLFGHGLAVHLLKTEHPPTGEDPNNKKSKDTINPVDDHISFQWSNKYSFERLLETRKGLKFERPDLKIEGKTVVGQLLFKDPDGNMIEVSDSQKLDIVPLGQFPPPRLPTPNLDLAESCDNAASEWNHQLALNHVAFVTNSLDESVEFYEDILGFVRILRPFCSFSFNGKWLFGHGIGIHLLESKDALDKSVAIDPKGNHISFQCSDMYSILRRLEEKGIEHVKKEIKERHKIVNQIFFNDHNGNTIEICNCQNLPIVPLFSSCPPKKR